jgi:MFS family permease
VAEKWELEQRSGGALKHVRLLDSTIVNVALPSLQREFHASVSELQWVADAYLLVIASLLLFAGSLGDRFGRRPLLRTGLVLFGAGSLACSLSPSLPFLIAFRMFQACGGCMLNPNSLSIISNTFRDPKERADAIGFWGGVVGISTAAGPVLGGALINAIDWRAIFWVNVPVVVLTPFGQLPPPGGPASEGEQGGIGLSRAKGSDLPPKAAKILGEAFTTATHAG